MMTRHLTLVLAGVFSVSLVSVLLPEPAQAVCRPYCLDLNKKRGEVRDFDRGDRSERRDRWEANKHRLHALLKHLHKKLKKHRGRGGHDDPPVTPAPVPQPPVTPPPVEPPPPPPGPTPCIGC
jgi:hypothetical protein